MVYAIESDGTHSEKAAAAQQWAARSDVCVSTHVLGEFYSVVTKPRRASPLTHDEATAWVQFWKRLDVIDVTRAHVDLALEIVGRYGIGYYDGLILATARLAGCVEVQSEDLNAGQNYGGVVVRNPFVR